MRILPFSFPQQLGDNKIIRLSIAASNLQLLPSLFENIQVTINMYKYIKINKGHN